jgi:hypothetical protein
VPFSFLSSKVKYYFLISLWHRPFGLTSTMFIYTKLTIINVVINTAPCSRILQISLLPKSLSSYIHLFVLSPNATRAQYLIHTALSSSTFTLQLKTRPLSRLSNSISFACVCKNLSLVNTRIPLQPLTASPLHGSLATAHCLAVTWFNRHPLTASP